MTGPSPERRKTSGSHGSRALQKLANYDDNLGPATDNVGLFKRIVIWPVKPTAAETRYALEFMGAAVDVYDEPKEQYRICGATIVHQPDNGTFEDELAIAMVVADYIDLACTINSSESGTRLMERAFKKRYCCS